MPKVIFRSKKPTPLDYRAMRNELIAGLKAEGEDIRNDFEKTVSTWKNKPDWKPSNVEPVIRGSIATSETYTENDVYGYVSGGAKPHIILPVNAKRLRFPGTFSPKSTPGTLTQGPGFSGPPIVYSDGVHHPGITARNFDKEIAEIAKINFPNKIQKAISKARSVSKHVMP